MWNYFEIELYFSDGTALLGYSKLSIIPYVAFFAIS